MDALIQAKGLTKIYTVKEKNKNGTLIKSIFNKRTKNIVALNDINFSIEKGSIVGLIGANGAGKSTAIKIITGILSPTSGEVSVFGKNPVVNRSSNSYKFGLMMGQKSQLWWELPSIDSFELYRRMYGISSFDYQEMMKKFNNMLEIDEFINRPVRQLSLGQRMRCELCVTLLHKPSILFLDEPTIGIDILAKDKILQFINQINKEIETTVILTTHDISDISKIAQKVMILDKSKLIYDGGIDTLRKHENMKIVEIEFVKEINELSIENVNVKKIAPNKLSLSFEKKIMPIQTLLSKILSDYDVVDITVQSPDIETIVKNIYKNNSVIHEV